MQKVEKKPRFLGIDLCRGLAAFAVIVVHSGDGSWGVPVSYWALQFRFFFYFAVPFFLAASFFFMTRNLSSNISWQFIKAKFQRIFIPYALWSTFYLVFGIIFFSLTRQTERLQQLLQDPISIVFFGGASYHLYFLPLLFSGTLLVFLVKNLVKRKNGIKIIAFLAIIGIVVNEIIAWSGNSFRLNPQLAFPSLLNSIEPNSIGYQIARFSLIQIAWMLRCLPYLCIATIVNYLLLKNESSLLKTSSTLLVFVTVFVFANTYGQSLIFHEFNIIIIAFSLLLAGICLSYHLNENRIIQSLGSCAFGIYLIHPLLKRITTIISTVAIPNLASQVTVISILWFSVSTFLFSWLVVSLLMKNKQFAKYIFGN
jgi:peptidoglycan/LPS O-acetylase OafA/YrhL